jgi:DNA polymerase III delta prime subunit
MKENFIWFEKYRCKEIADMALPKQTETAFETFIKKQDIPHLLLYGHAGSGKTTIAKIMIDYLPCSSLMLNASSKDRGVETVKGKINSFASSKPPVGKRFKIIFLDEFHGMTLEAQEALKNTFETYSSTCRFILTANNYSKVLKEIRSRCMQFEFSQFPKTNVIDMCAEILEEEGVSFKEKDIDTIINRAYPDIRSIINNLQKCSITGKVDLSGLMTCNLTEDEISRLIKCGAIKKLREAWAGSGSFNWIYTFLFDEFILSIDKQLQPDIALTISEFLHRDTTIADKELNATACIISIMQELNVGIKF